MFLKTWSIAIVISENDSIVFFKQTVYLWQMGVMFMTRWGIYNIAFGDYPKQILTYIMSILIYLILLSNYNSVVDTHRRQRIKLHVSMEDPLFSYHSTCMKTCRVVHEHLWQYNCLNLCSITWPYTLYRLWIVNM